MTLPTDAAEVWAAMIDTTNPMPIAMAIDLLMEITNCERPQAVSQLHIAAGEWLEKQCWTTVGFPISQTVEESDVGKACASIKRLQLTEARKHTEYLEYVAKEYAVDGYTQWSNHRNHCLSLLEQVQALH